MLTLRGRVENIIRMPARVKDGKTLPGYCQVQMFVSEPMQDGQKRLGMQTLSIEDPAPFEEVQGREVRVPVGAYVRNGSLALFMQKGSLPELIKLSEAVSPYQAPL